MDLNMMLQTAKHSPVVVFAAGLACANARGLLHCAVLAVFKVPALRAWLVGNPEQAKAALAAFVAEVDADIDALQVSEARKAPPPPPAPAP